MLFYCYFDLLCNAVLGVGIYIAGAFGLGFDHALLAYGSDLGVARLIAKHSVLLDLLAALVAIEHVFRGTAQLGPLDGDVRLGLLRTLKL